MAEVFTYGRWTVTPGKHDEFQAAWRDLADWTLANIEGAGWAKLLMDGEDPNLFLSFGTWTDPAAIQRWRSSDGFAEHIGRMRGLLDDFEAHIAQVVVDVG